MAAAAAAADTASPVVVVGGGMGSAIAAEKCGVSPFKYELLTKYITHLLPKIDKEWALFNPYVSLRMKPIISADGLMRKIWETTTYKRHEKH